MLTFSTSSHHSSQPSSPHLQKLSTRYFFISIVSKAVFQPSMHCTVSFLSLLFCFATPVIFQISFYSRHFSLLDLFSCSCITCITLLYSGQNVVLNLWTFFWLVREKKKTGMDIPNHTGIYHLFMHIMQVPNWYHKYLVRALKRNKPRPCHPHAVAAEVLGLRWHGCLLAKVNFRSIQVSFCSEPLSKLGQAHVLKMDNLGCTKIDAQFENSQLVYGRGIHVQVCQQCNVRGWGQGQGLDQRTKKDQKKIKGTTKPLLAILDIFWEGLFQDWKHTLLAPPLPPYVSKQLIALFHTQPLLTSLVYSIAARMVNR